MSTISGSYPAPQGGYVSEPIAETKSFLGTISDGFWGFFNWVGSFFSYGSDEVKPYELTPEQKQRIEEIYYQALEIIKNLDHPESKEDVRAFLHQLKEYYKRQSDLLKTESESLYQNYEFNRKKVQKHQEDERQEFEKMLADAASGNFWQRVTGALVPIYTALAALALPPGLNVAVICVSIIFALEELSDHSLTASIAEAVAGGDMEHENVLKERLQLTSSLLSIGLSIPVGMGASVPLSVMFGLAKAGTAAADTTTKISTQGRQARLTEIKNEAEKFSRKLNEQISQMQKVSEAQGRITKQTLHMIEAQRKASAFHQGG